MTNDVRVGQLLKALDSFKDWSNYLLVTTVAALGWVSTKDAGELAGHWKLPRIWAFALSVVFGIFTLALVPHIAEQLTSGDSSIYAVRASFHLFIFFGEDKPWVSLTWVCFPQHILFLAGIILYAVGSSPGHTT